MKEVLKSEINSEDLEKINTLSTTSDKIRYLDSIGYTRSKILTMGLTTKTGNPIRYQHVRNVLITPIKKKK